MNKVMFVPEFGDYGGIFDYFGALLDYYISNNYEIVLVLSKNQILKIINSGIYPKIDRNHQIKICEVNNKSNLELRLNKKFIFNIFFDLKKYFKIFKTEKPDFLVISTGSPGSLLSLILLNIRFIYICHSYPNNGKKYSLKNIVLNIFLCRKKRILTVSYFAKNNFVKFWNLNKKSDFINVIYNTVFKKEFYIDDASEIKEEISDPYYKNILTLGHMRWYKNPEAWLEVAKIIALKDKSIRFIWAGDGELYNEFIEKIKLAKIENAILLGFIGNIDFLYKKSLIYFQPSLIENHSLSILNAMEYGIPCIVSKVGGSPESVIEGETGFVIDVNNYQKMADKILLLLENKDLYKNMSQSSKKRFDEKFSYKIWKNNMDEIHKEI